MKIIQPSRSLRKERASNNESSSQSRDQQPVYKRVDVDFLSQIDKNKPRKKAKSKEGEKSWKHCTKRTYGERIENESQNREEFYFDTNNLESMPKQEVPAPIIEGKKRRRSELVTEKADRSLELMTEPAKKEFNELFARGVRLLAMREHSVKEIINKLFDKSENDSTIHAVVDELLKKKYLSDDRFTENYIRARCNRGFGPVKIRAELKSRGITNILIQDHLDEGADIWFDSADSQCRKKYGGVAIRDYSSWTKRARFLQSRGFTMEQIQVALPEFSSE